MPGASILLMILHKPPTMFFLSNWVAEFPGRQHAVLQRQYGCMIVDHIFQLPGNVCNLPGLYPQEHQVDFSDVFYFCAGFCFANSEVPGNAFDFQPLFPDGCNVLPGLQM